MPLVKFKDAGKWAEMDPRVPQFKVEANETKEVSHGLADIVVKANRGTIFVDPNAEKLIKAQGVADKAKADHIEAQGVADKAKADAGAATGADKAEANKEVEAADKALATLAEKLETADKTVAELAG